MQVLEIGIAQHQAIIGVPQHEGFRDGFDGVAQAQIGRRRLFHQALLFSRVDYNADEVQAGIALLANKFATGAQPQPIAVGVAHAKGVIERLCPGIGECGGDVVEIDIVGVHQHVDFAEGQQVVLRLDAQNVEHGMRPEHAPARQVPIPQPAAAAIERGVDAAAHRIVNDVGFARTRRLPVEGEAEDENNEAGRGRQRHRQRSGGSPCRQRVAPWLHDGNKPCRILQCAHRRDGLNPVRKRDLEHSSGGAKRGQRL